MKFILTLILTLVTTQIASAECDLKDYKRDIKEINSRKDYDAKEKRAAIEQAKQNIREEVIECVLRDEPVSKEAADFVKAEIENDQSTKPAAAKDLLGLIDDKKADF